MCREAALQPSQTHRRHNKAALSKGLLDTKVPEVIVSHRAAFLLAASCSAAFISVPAVAAVQRPPTSAAPSAGSAAADAKPITRNQFAAQLDNSFKTLDTNGDKALSQAEIDAAQARTAAQAQAAAGKRIEEEFAKTDTNKDGQLSLAEVKAKAPAPRMAGSDQMIQKLDANKDGKIGQDEYRAIPLANFDRLDSDKDGALSPQEQKAVNSPR
jgi:Ca2+-binding EF-hand superfamily protein